MARLFIATVALACLAFAAAASTKEAFSLTDGVTITPNENKIIDKRSDGSIEDTVESYVKSHDATFNFPSVGAQIDLTARNLDNDEFDVKVKLSNGEVSPRKKSKLKKVFIPLLVFLLLKVMTLVPLAIGVLAMKAWNGLQLSFFSFIISVGLAIFEMCRKLSYDAHHPQIISNEPWKTQYAARSFDEEATAQNMAYSAYVN